MKLKLAALVMLLFMFTGVFLSVHGSRNRLDVQQADAAASVAQTAVFASSGDSDTSCTTTFSGNTSIGDLLVVNVACNSFPNLIQGQLFTISSIGLWTWTQLAGGYSTDFSESAIYVGIAQSAAENITVSGCTGTYICISQDFSGGPTAIILDNLGVGTGNTSGSTLEPPNYTSANANDLIFGMGAQAAATFASSPGAPWANSTAAAGGIGGAGQVGQAAWQATTSAGSFRPSWGTSTSNWAAAAGAIHASATPFPTPAWIESGH